MIKQLLLFILLASVLITISAAPLVTNGLFAYYDFAGNASDTSGRTNNGTVYGATLTSDRFGAANSAYSFDGNDYILVNHSSDFNVTTGMTISAWVKFNTNPYTFSQDRSYIVDKAGAWRLWYSANGEGSSEPDQMFYDVWDWQGANSTQGTWNTGPWYHVVSTFSNGQAKMYINGVLHSTSSTKSSLYTNSNNIFIGKAGDASSYFNGTIDDLGFYNRALSDTEITLIYQQVPEAGSLWLILAGISFLFYRTKKH